MLLNPEQERLFNEVQVVANEAVLSFSKEYPDLDADAFSDYLQRKLLKYCSKFKPEKGDGMTFARAVIRCKTRGYIERASRQTR